MTPRQFAGLVGVLLALAGLTALMLPIEVDEPWTLSCGSALATKTDLYSGGVLEACEDAISTRRAWGWPLAAVGVLVVFGAAVVRQQKPSSEPRPAP